MIRHYVLAPLSVEAVDASARLNRFEQFMYLLKQLYRREMSLLLLLIDNKSLSVT